MSQLSITGAKGGGGQRAPVQAPDSLRSIAYFRILDLVSEGEIGGLVNGLQSVYLNDTPLANADGSLNFQNAHVESRTGTQDQDYIPGYGAVENEISIGVELKSAAPWVRAISNTQLSAVRITLGVPQLQSTDTGNGDINGYTVAYHIDVQTDGGAWQTALTSAFTGKTTTKYQRSHRIDLPTATTGWNVRVVRTTANANSATIADATTVDSYTEIIDAKLRYPNSALVAVSGDAATFSNIPSRAYDLWGRLIRVPSNYDPLTRTYAGVWDGSFKIAWTNNPAWVFLDLVTHPRYGLGNMVTDAQIDKWALYAIAQYCDQSVPDGNGATEPRFTCNVFLQTAGDAYKLLGDLASLFRGIAWWSGSAIRVSADLPADPTYLYTAANVIDGKFTYASSARKTRYTTALVAWNNPANNYVADAEYVQHDAGLRRYGIQPLQVTAFGCTSRGQAQRTGQWALMTAQAETETVTFSVGLDGMLAAPGQIIRVQDPARAGKRQGGRIHAATATAITVDKIPDAVAGGDKLTCTLPSGTTETHAITAIAGTTLSVAAPGFSAAPQAESGWLIESTTLMAQQFRVVNVVEDKSSDKISFTLTAVQNVAAKYDAIDTSAALQSPPISVLPATTQAPVASVSLSGGQVTVQGTSQTVVTIAWPPAEGADTYRVGWRRNDGEWIDAGGTPGCNMLVYGAYTGTYVASVRAISAGGVASIPTESAPTAIAGKAVAPPPPTLTAAGGQLQIVLNWTWPAGVNVEDTSYTEVWISPTSTMADGESVGAVAYPGTSYTISGLLPQQQRWAWVRLVDKSGNVGSWSLPANAVGGTAADLFQPLQDQVTATQNDVDAAIAAVAQEVSDRTAAISNEANARATAILNEQNARIAAISTEQTIRQSADDSLATIISQVSAGTGEQFDPAKIWYFDTTVDGWSGNGTPTITDGWLRAANHASDPYVASPTGLAVAGQSYRFAKLRIKQVGAPTWAGELRWRLTGDAAGAWRGPVSIAAPDFDVNGVTTISWQDLAWWPGTVDQVRIDLTSAQTASNYFLIDWVAVGRPTPGAGVAALQDESAARVTADAAEATQRTTLATQMRGSYTGTDVASVTTGLIYSERQARSTADGAMASDIAAVQARMPSGTGKVATEASVTDETSARVTADSALSTRTGTMEARMPSGTGELATSATVATESTARATADTAMASDIALLGAHNADKTAFNLNSNTVKIDGSQTLAQTLTSLQASDAALGARVDNEQTARVSGDAANASAITNVSSRVSATELIQRNMIPNPTGALGFGGLPNFGWIGGAKQNMKVVTDDTMGNAGPMFACWFPGTGAVDQGFNTIIPCAVGPVTLSADMCIKTAYTGALFIELRFLNGTGAEIDATKRPRISAVQGAMARYTATSALPSGTTSISVVVRFAGTMAANSVASWRNIKLEVGSVATPFVDSATIDASASATTQLTAGTTIGGTAYAAATTMVDANGCIGGTRLASDGSVSSFAVVADQFSIVAPGGGARTEYSGGNWRVYDAAGTLRVRMGVW